jgi:acetolactate synthase small subunit
MSRHTLSVLVQDQPGVLARVAGLFSRRGFNIESLAVGPTEIPDVSRMTIVVNVEGLALEQVTKQLNKLINVLKIVELDEASSVQREIMLVKVKADAETFARLLPQYEKTPRIILSRLWEDARETILTGDDVETFYTVPGQLELQLNRDPNLQKERQREQLRSRKQEQRKITEGR